MVFGYCEMRSYSSELLTLDSLVFTNPMPDIHVLVMPRFRIFAHPQMILTEKFTAEGQFYSEQNAQQTILTWGATKIATSTE